MGKIVVDNISKKFKIGCGRHGILYKIISLISGRGSKKEIEVFKNISFSVSSYQLLGIHGPNGSGKSTLLRIMAGIYRPDSGKVLVNGKMISLINLNAGLKERLTMRENIFLIGSIFGQSRGEIKKEFYKIVEFSGLSDFLETKIYQFSEGMKQRLVFSVGIFSNPEILLLDEVFEVGDEDFKQKSAQKIKEMVKSGGCAVLVSHNMDLIKKYCDKIVLLDKGQLFKEKPF